MQTDLSGFRRDFLSYWSHELSSERRICVTEISHHVQGSERPIGNLSSTGLWGSGERRLAGGLVPDLRRTLPLHAHMRSVDSTPLTTPTHSLHTEHEEGPARAPRLWAREGGLLLWSWSCLILNFAPLSGHLSVLCSSGWHLCSLAHWMAISLSLAPWVAISF